MPLPPEQMKPLEYVTMHSICSAESRPPELREDILGGGGGGGGGTQCIRNISRKKMVDTTFH